VRPEVERVLPVEGGRLRVAPRAEAVGAAQAEGQEGVLVGSLGRGDADEARTPRSNAALPTIAASPWRGSNGPSSTRTLRTTSGMMKFASAYPCPWMCIGMLSGTPPRRISMPEPWSRSKPRRKTSFPIPSPSS
jgi:hypothetical protein